MNTIKVNKQMMTDVGVDTTECMHKIDEEGYYFKSDIVVPDAFEDLKDIGIFKDYTQMHEWIEAIVNKYEIDEDDIYEFVEDMDNEFWNERGISQGEFENGHALLADEDGIDGILSNDEWYQQTGKTREEFITEYTDEDGNSINYVWQDVDLNKLAELYIVAKLENYEGEKDIPELVDNDNTEIIQAFSEKYPEIDRWYAGEYFEMSQEYQAMKAKIASMSDDELCSVLF